MKKIIASACAALAVIGAIPMSAAAANTDKLPFELTAPENVAIEYLNGNDALNSCQVAWSKNDSMSEWMNKMSDPETHDAAVAELNKLGWDDMWATPQMDWSIDTQDDWHYNEYWDTEGYDKDNKQHLGEWAYTDFLESPDKTVTAWVFRDMGNAADPNDTWWFGVHNEDDDIPGWKDVLKEDQYTLIESDGEKHAKIDFTQHTIYVRMRYLVTCRPAEGDDVKIASEWSEIAAVGKDAPEKTVVKEGEVAAPLIKDLRMTDEEFNTYPVIAFKIDIPAELIKAQTDMQSDYDKGAYISLEVEARVQGKENWVGLQGDWTLKSGELKYGLQNLAEAEKSVSKDTPIELRARYNINNGETEFYSPYSEILTFGSKEMNATPDSVVDSTENVTEAASAAPKEEKKSENKCSLCGFCPHPLGICIFIWIAIIVAVAAVVVITIIVMKKKKQQPQDTTAKEDNKE